MPDVKQRKEFGSLRTLIKVLSKHYESLASAGSDEVLLKEYSTLLKFLSSAKREEVRKIFDWAPAQLKGLGQGDPQFKDSDIATFPIEKLEKILNDESTPRKFLERIAIQRFNVPAGSMRSFSNRRMLVEKLTTLIHNELAHTTIENVARR